MWILIPIALVLAAVIALWLRLVPPPFAASLLKFDGDKIQARKGILRPYARDQLVELLRDKRIGRGFIAVLRNGRVVFSRSVPAEMHQRLRNVLLNQNS